MTLWIPFTIAAAALQTARSAMQKQMMGALGGAAATYARFAFGAPVALCLYAAAALGFGGAPAPTAPFALWAMVGGASQIFATAALLQSFRASGFAVGTAFSKTEPLLAALASAVLLSEAPGWLALLGIVLSVAGVFLATFGGRFNRLAAGFGIGSAALFALSAVAYRAASLELPSGEVLVRATTTLVAATWFQAVVMGAWMALRAPGELRALVRAWRPGLLIGAAGAAASACWFAAFTLEPAAHVRTLGQVELLFTIVVAMLAFGERPHRREWLGMALMMVGLSALLTATGQG